MRAGGLFVEEVVEAWLGAEFFLEDKHALIFEHFADFRIGI